MKKFRGKTALVTGASSGIGEECARILARNQCNLVLVARREERLRALQEELTGKYGIQVDVIVADLLKPNAAEDVFAQTRSLGRDIDILINNAGFGKNGEFLDVPLESHTQMIQLLITAVTELTYVFAEHMKERGGGYILQVASIAAYMPVPSFSTYGAAKAYVLNFGQTLTKELKPHNIQVTVLSPGGTLSEFMDVSGQNIRGWRTKAMMSSHEVAEAGLKALARGCSSVVPGWLYKISIAGLRLIPRGAQAGIADAALN